jgi:hypothetical protein
MTWVATTVFSNITSISEIVVTSLGARGLLLHRSSRARSFSSRSVAVTLKKEPGQIKTTYREIQISFKPKIGKVTIRISLLE